MKITCVSDLHGYYPETVGGDLLIVAGDCTANDGIECWTSFFSWIDAQDYEKKVVVAGNHDNFAEKFAIKGSETEKKINWQYPKEAPLFDYLCDSGIEYQGYKIWGSPYTAFFSEYEFRCRAFMVNSHKLKDHWQLIPKDTDILITHSPPQGILDQNFYDQYVGCPYLREAVGQIKPKVHVFGHIHESYGSIVLGPTTFVNASHVNQDYMPMYNPINLVINK